MNLEAAAVTTLLALATAPLVVWLWRSRPRMVGAGAIALWLVGSAAMAVTASRYPTPSVAVRTADVRPLEAAGYGYVTSKSCQACHPQEYGTWHDSYHRTMTTVATPETVKAPFKGERVTARGREYVFQRRGDEFWVQMDDPDWEGFGTTPRVWKQIVQITGSHHWQFYWYPSGHSRKLSILLCSYRLADEPRWTPLDGCCISPPNSGQESGSGRWSTTCNKCHSTHGRPRIESHTHMDTHVAELGIACEACHGPGQEHVDINRDPRRRYAMHFADGPDETIVNPARLPNDRASHVCANCHSVTTFNTDEDRVAWSRDGFSFRPGDDLSASRTIHHGSGDRTDKFWADGMIRVSGREYSGMAEAPCFKAGEMSCLSCHVMHQPPDDPRPRKEWANDQLKLHMDGNLACTQCHEAFADDATLVAHTHHRADSAGSNCYNCHMSYTTYGLLKAIRSHQLDNPSVATSVQTGRPNACNQCHLDRTMQWAAEHLERWYDIPQPELDEDERTIAASLLWGLEGDAGQRALIAWSMGWEPARLASGTSWMPPYLAIMMTGDPYHSVRYLAHRSSMKHDEFRNLRFDYMDHHEQRLAATHPIFSTWMNRGSTHRRAPHLLLDDQGKVDMNIVNRLLQEQDTRDITLNE